MKKQIEWNGELIPVVKNIDLSVARTVMVTIYEGPVAYDVMWEGDNLVAVPMENPLRYNAHRHTGHPDTIVRSWTVHNPNAKNRRCKK